jgi:hypothetical protein
MKKRPTITIVNIRALIEAKQPASFRVVTADGIPKGSTELSGSMLISRQMFAFSSRRSLKFNPGHVDYSKLKHVRKRKLKLPESQTTRGPKFYLLKQDLT